MERGERGGWKGLRSEIGQEMDSEHLPTRTKMTVSSLSSFVLTEMPQE